MGVPLAGVPHDHHAAQVEAGGQVGIVVDRVGAAIGQRQGEGHQAGPGPGWKGDRGRRGGRRGLGGVGNGG